jgi:hypothetical protein
MPFISSVRGSFGAQAKGFKSPPLVVVSPAVNGKTLYNLNTENIIFNTAGEYTISTVGVLSFRSTMWGAGGGGAGSGWNSSWSGGAGGFSTGIISTSSNPSFTIIVGEGGYGPVTGPTGNGNFCTIGGGASSAPPPSGGDYQYSGGGGGFTGIFTGTTQIHTTNILSSSNYKNVAVQSRSVLIAGGGGGGGNNSSNSNNHDGGHGGGSSGTGGYRNSSLISATAGTQSATGTPTVANGSWDPSPIASLNNYGVPGRMQAGPGSGGTYGGGGGGGYFGGATSVDQPNGQMGGGGGGSGYVNTAIVSSGSTTAGSSRTDPSNTGNALYASPAGQGGAGTRSTSNGTRGSDGRLVISLT